MKTAHPPIYCTASMNYVPGTTPGDGEIRSIDVTVFDGRQALLPSWQICGFELENNPSAVTDWNDDCQIAATHYAEISHFARQLTGCDHALVSSHILRNPQTAAIHPDLAPITFVHSDFAANYGRRMREFYSSGHREAELGLAAAGITAAEVVNAGRMLILQFWRNVGPARMDLPIAFCDARSVSSADVTAIHVDGYAGDDFAFDTLGVVAPSDPNRHRWYTFPDMHADEVVVFRTFDSAMIDTGGHYWTPHSAFSDPQASTDLPGRYSIELRATCLFGA